MKDTRAVELTGTDSATDRNTALDRVFEDTVVPKLEALMEACKDAKFPTLLAIQLGDTPEKGKIGIELITLGEQTMSAPLQIAMLIASGAITITERDNTLVLSSITSEGESAIQEILGNVERKNIPNNIPNHENVLKMVNDEELNELIQKGEVELVSEHIKHCNMCNDVFTTVGNSEMLADTYILKNHEVIGNPNSAPITTGIITIPSKENIIH